MFLQKLDVYRVRNIQNATIYPSPAINLIYGNNGSGKSSLLEAIFILGRARSFRTNAIKQVISHTADDLVVFGHCFHEKGISSNLGVQLTTKDSEIRINNSTNCKRADLAYAFPVQFFFPKSYQLLDGASSLRREFIDWGLFNQNPQYLSIWQKFKKCLLHRNALLKSNRLSQLSTWDNELIHYSTLISELRASYVAALEVAFSKICHLFFAFSDIKLVYFPGWDLTRDLSQVFSDNLAKDARLGVTHSGAHRSDFYIKINDRNAREFVSRGQLKLLVLALKLSQIQLLSVNFSKITCFLLDDFSAELDLHNKKIVLQFLASLNIQVFITANELALFGDISFLTNYKLFHVEQGNISPVVF